MSKTEPGIQPDSSKAAASRGGVAVSGDVSDSTFITAMVTPENLGSLRSVYQPPELPAIWNLPNRGDLPPGSRLSFPPNAVFTGREDYLIKLAEDLLFSDTKGVGITQEVAVATGLGGIGKSQLAVEFCYRYGRFFYGVHWIQVRVGNTESEIVQNIDAEIAACGNSMRLSSWPDKIPDQVALTLNAWSEGGPRLVVLDNIEDSTVIQNILPKLPKVRLLITSRRSNWPAHLGLKTWPLDVLSRPQSKELLCRLSPRLRDAPDEELDIVAERLGDLPLALDLAGRYLEDCYDLSPEGYLEELVEAGNALEHTSLKDWVEDSPTKHATSLAATFTLSWSRLNEHEIDTLARQIFRACGYCAPNTPIPRQLFAEISHSDSTLYRALNRLSNLGLVIPTNEGPRLHPLLSEFARIQDGDAEDRILPTIANTLKDLSSKAIDNDTPYQMEPLREHLRAIAGSSEDAGLEVAIRLWSNFGYYLCDAAEFSEAKHVLERAQEKFKDVYGLDHPDVIRIIGGLGRVLSVLGDFKAAMKNYNLCLELELGVYGSDHREIAGTLSNIALILKKLGDNSGAKEKAEQALAIREKVQGSNHPEVANTLSNLAMIQKELGDMNGARKNLERAHEIVRGIYGPDHINEAAILCNLGGILESQGDLRGAKRNFERGLEIEIRIHGPDHPAIAVILNNLGNVLRKKGDYKGAKANYERTLEIQNKVFGQYHVDSAMTLGNLGWVLQNMGNAKDARRNLEQSLKILNEKLGEDHPSTRKAKHELKLMKRGVGRGSR